MASYPAVIELRVDGVTQVTRVLDTIGKLDRALVSIKKTPLAIDSGRATDGIRVLKKEVDSFIISLGNGTKQLATTTAGLNSQAAAFRNLAANAKIGGEAFKLYTQAAEQARQKTTLTGGLAEIKAQTQLYKVGRTAATQAFKGVDELVKFSSQVPKNTASLELYKAELERVLSVIEYGTQDYRNLERAIAAVNKQMAIGQGMGPQFGPAAPGKAAGKGAAVAGIGATLRKRVPGAISSAIIGGGFPLLFGQGAAAAAGGGLGGLAGGLLGGGFGFALSIAGTAIGEIAGQAQKIKQLGTDMGFSAQQADVLGKAFKQANTDIEKFSGVIQNIRGLGLELESQAELIKLTTALTEKYGGQFDKVGNAITSALESGKVSQATLNQLTSQGINVQQALADKFGVSRDRLLEMAKKGEIGVQDLVNALVDMGNKGVEATKQPAAGMEKLQQAASNLGSGIATLAGIIYQKMKPVLDWLAGTLAGIVDLAANVVNAISKALSGGSAVEVKARAAAQKRLLEARPELKNTLIARGGAFGKGGTTLTAAGEEKLSAADRQLLETYYQAELKGITKPTPIKPIDVRGLGQTAAARGGSDKAAKDAAKLKQQIQEQLISAANLVTQKQAELNYTKAISDEDKLKTKYDASRTERMQTYVKLLSKSLSDAERLSLIEAQRLDIQISNSEYEKELSDIRKQEVQNIYAALDASSLLNLNFERMASFVGAGKAPLAFNPNLNLVPGITGGELGAQAEVVRLELEKLITPVEQLKTAAEGIGTAFGDSFKAAASGAMTAQEALSSFFQSVADRFLDMAAQIIAKWIEMTILNTALQLFPGSGLFKGAGPVSGVAAFSGAGMGSKGFFLPDIIRPRAMGGSVSAGSPYMVGERGPELFVPGRSGTIVPNNALSAGGTTSVVVNVDAGASNVQGNDAQASQLGKVIGLAVQQELIKQKRPGGLLS